MAASSTVLTAFAAVSGNRPSRVSYNVCFQFLNCSVRVKFRLFFNVCV